MFFEDPRITRHGSGDYSVLYLLRRDVCVCLGRDPTSGVHTSHRALLPGAMAILAGIDLVAKFYKGRDDSEVGDRFKEFVCRYFQPICPGDEETIYQLRNSLLHSFGLYSKTKRGEYRFLLSAEEGGRRFVQRLASGWHQIDLNVLCRRFERALAEYRADLKNQGRLKKKFLKMFKNYGALRIGTGYDALP